MGRFITKETRESLKIIGQVSSMGIAMVLATVFGLAAGYFFDKWLGTQPWGLIVGLVMGIIAGYRNIYIIMKRTKNL